MRISWGEDYAVIFMNNLAKNYSHKLVSLSEVARENKISVAFLKQIAMHLKQKGLIASKEGVGGGYKLAKKPSDISLLDVVSAVNKHWGLTSCCHLDQNEEKCPREDFCQTKNTWQRVNQEINDKLKSISILNL